MNRDWGLGELRDSVGFFIGMNGAVYFLIEMGGVFCIRINLDDGKLALR